MIELEGHVICVQVFCIRVVEGPGWIHGGRKNHLFGISLEMSGRKTRRSKNDCESFIIWWNTERKLGHQRTAV